MFHAIANVNPSDFYSIAQHQRSDLVDAWIAGANSDLHEQALDLCLQFQWKAGVKKLAEVVDKTILQEQALFALNAQCYDIAQILVSKIDPKPIANEAISSAVFSGSMKLVHTFLPHIDPPKIDPDILTRVSVNGLLDMVVVLQPICNRDQIAEALSYAAGQGHADIVDFLLKHSDHTANSVALAAAAYSGHMDILRTLLKVSDPKYNNSAALAAAARAGRLRVIKALLPYSDPLANNSEALTVAVVNEQYKAVECLIPVSDPLANNSEALQQAVIYQLHKYIDLLWPVSDPQAALKVLQEKYPNEIFGSFEQRVIEKVAQDQRDTLFNTIGNNKGTRAPRVGKI